jgi:fatty-acyl-CoA synthase
MNSCLQTIWLTSSALIVLQCKIVDTEGRTVPVGHVGELCTKGYVCARPVGRGNISGHWLRGWSCRYLVMKGYWNNPKKTEESIDAGGWMHTGDLAGAHPPAVVVMFLQQELSQLARACLFLVFDEDGFCKIVGRSKDVIIRGGENVYPREIEEFLYTHPAIEDVQVIGVPNTKVRYVAHTPCGI